MKQAGKPLPSSAIFGKPAETLPGWGGGNPGSLWLRLEKVPVLPSSSQPCGRIGPPLTDGRGCRGHSRLLCPAPEVESPSATVKPPLFANPSEAQGAASGNSSGPVTLCPSARLEGTRACLPCTAIAVPTWRKKRGVRLCSHPSWVRLR